MLKHCNYFSLFGLFLQPPSGGCVLKHYFKGNDIWLRGAATFGWLCVETHSRNGGGIDGKLQPPSGGCVLKHISSAHMYRERAQPPSGGCVLKQ